MVQIIMAILKVAWLAISYTMIFSGLAGRIPALIAWCVSVFDFMEYVIPFITAAVGTCRWLIGNYGFNFALWAWLMLPAVKLSIYFSHKAATFGGLASHAIDSSINTTNK